MKRLSLSFCLTLLLLFAAESAQAAESEARQRLETTINSVLKELDKPGIHNPAERGAIIDRVEQLIQQLFDSAELSARTVGPSWKTFSPEQKAQFTDVFTSLLRHTYLDKFEGYDGELISYTGETASSNGDRVEIQTSVSVKDKPVLVAYRMLKKQQWVVYDVIIEGVSMVQNYRTQFQELLAKGDPDALIAQVKRKAQEAAKPREQRTLQ